MLLFLLSADIFQLLLVLLRSSADILGELVDPRLVEFLGMAQPVIDLFKTLLQLHDL